MKTLENINKGSACKFSNAELLRMLPKALQFVFHYMDQCIAKHNDPDDIALMSKPGQWQCHIKTSDPAFYGHFPECEAVLEVVHKPSSTYWEILVMSDESFRMLE